jgi:hypothetical protein
MADSERDSCDLAEPNAVASKRKFVLCKRRKKEDMNEAEKQSGETNLTELFIETNKAINMMVVDKDVNEESQTGATTLEKSRSFERCEAIAEPLNGQQRNASSSSTLLESEMIRVLGRNVVLPKEDGASYQSSLDYSYSDWESALSQVKEGGITFDIFPDDEVSLRHENAPVFVEGLKNGITSSEGRKSGADLEEAHWKAVPLNVIVAKRRARL